MGASNFEVQYLPFEQGPNNHIVYPPEFLDEDGDLHIMPAPDEVLNIVDGDMHAVVRVGGERAIRLPNGDITAHNISDVSVEGYRPVALFTAGGDLTKGEEVWSFTGLPEAIVKFRQYKEQ